MISFTTGVFAEQTVQAFNYQNKFKKTLSAVVYETNITLFCFVNVHLLEL